MFPTSDGTCFQTFANLQVVHNNSIPKEVEGGSFVHVMKNGGKGVITRPRDSLVFHFPHYQSDDGPQSAIRVGNMKLIYFYDTERSSLFDLSNDIGERNDLASNSLNKLFNLSRKLKSYLAEINAQSMTKNPISTQQGPLIREKGTAWRKQNSNQAKK